MSLVADWRQIATLAAKEWRDRLRNKWLLAITLLFAAFAFVISYFGGAQTGGVGIRGVEVTIASLVSLVIYLVPLIALFLGFDAVVGERERGTLDLLLSMPLHKGEFLLGKFLGLAAALACACLLGLGVVGIWLYYWLGEAVLLHYTGFAFSTLLLGLCFLSLALLASVLSRDRTQAGGIAIGLWFFFVLVFDLLLLAALVMFGDREWAEPLPLLMSLNPADLYRLLNIFRLEDAQSLYGLGTAGGQWLSSPLLLTGLLLVWVALPLLLAYWRFRRS